MIERKLKGQDIHLSSDYLRLTKKACVHPKPYEAIFLSHEYFLNCENYEVYRSIRPGNGKGDPEVRDIRALRYNPDSFCIEFKLLFDDQYCELPQRQKYLT